MANNLLINLVAEPVRFLAASSIDNTYKAAANGVLEGSEFPVRQVLVQNGTDGDVMISLGGLSVPTPNTINDQFPVFSGSFVLLDITTNKTDPAGQLYISTGTVAYVTQLSGASGGAGYADPTTGSVFVTFFYAK